MREGGPAQGQSLGRRVRTTTLYHWSKEPFSFSVYVDTCNFFYGTITGNHDNLVVVTLMLGRLEERKIPVHLDCSIMK